MKKKLIDTLKVTIVGEPNVGKSTLLNKILKKKISIVSRKSQTTIKKKTGSLIYDNKQIIFLDTPGIFGKNQKLIRSTFKQASNAILDSNLVLILINAVKPNIIKTNEILSYLKSLEKNFLIIINKIDLLDKDTYLKKINLIKNNFKKLEIITLSANKELGIKELLKYLIKNYKFYAKSVCNNNLEVESDFVEDVVREKVLANVHEEIPYNLKFKTDKLTENKDKSYKINLSIIYSKKSHKPIILGKNGKNIRKISMTARQDLERIYKRKFHLFLFLKEIKKNRVKIGNLEK